MAEIENQGRHSGEGFKELAEDLWQNKPLLIVLLAGLGLMIYLMARRGSSAIIAPTTPTNPAPGASSPSAGGTLLQVLEEQPEPNVTVTVNTPTPTQQQQQQQQPPPKKVPTPFKPKPGPNPPPPKKVPTPFKPKPALKTVLPAPSHLKKLGVKTSPTGAFVPRTGGYQHA